MNFNQILFQYRIIHVNIRGVRANKLNLEHYLVENNYPEIVTLNETLLRWDKNVKINGYYCAARKEPIGESGKHGSMILVKETIQDVVELDFLKSQFQDEVIGIEIKKKDRRPGLNIVTYYNPPGNRVNPSIFQGNLYINSSTIFTGDLNCKNTAWGSNTTDSQGTDLAETLDDQNWFVLNDGSKTRIDPRTGKEEVLDFVICNGAVLNMRPEFYVGSCVGSDHLPLHCNIVFDTPNPGQPILFRNVSQMDCTRYKEHITSDINQMPDSFETIRDLDRIADILPEVVRNAFEASCPQRQKKQKQRPVSPLILALIKKKRELRRKKSEAALRADTQSVREIQKEMSQVGNQIKKEQKREERLRLETACQRLCTEDNPRKFFQSVKSITCTDDGVSARTKVVKDELGNIASTAQERIELFANRLERVHQTPDYVGFDDGWKISVERYIQQNNVAFKTNPIAKYLEPEEGDDSPLITPPTVDEVADHLRNCRTNSAPGQDGIGYNLLKKVPPSYLAYITKFFAACIRIGYFPKAWKHAKTIMVPKPGKDLSIAKNYRPISLLSCLGKLFERLLAGRLSKYLETKGLFNKNQSGYRKGKMSSDHLLRLVEESHKGFRNNEVTASLFLDAEAAFDKCWHDGVRYKLKNTLGLPDRIVRVLSSFLTDRTLQVTEMGLFSKVVNLRAGTPQGSCLSPLIYIISVNDLPTGENRGTQQFQFADDIAICGSGKDELMAVRKVQRAVDDVESWCRKWRVKLNGDKSNLVILSRKKKKQHENLCILLFNDVVRPISKAKFLGIEIDNVLRFKQHIQALAQRAEKRLNILRILSWGGTEPKTLIRLYKVYVRSIFEYGAVAFLHCPNSTLDIMQKIQNKAIRICLRLPMYVSLKILHKNSCLPTIKERLHQLGGRLLQKMKESNPLIRQLVEEKQNHNIKMIRKWGQSARIRSHCSPLDIILPVQ